jgi:predicted transcriptional regulator
MSVKDVFNLHKRGMRRKDIAKELGMTQKDVDAEIGKEKFKIPKVKITPEVFKEFYETYDKENVKNICIKMGRTVGELRRLLAALDFEIPLTLKKHSSKTNIKEIADLYSKGNSIGFISRNLHIPRTTVSNCIKNNQMNKGKTQEEIAQEEIKYQEKELADSIKDKYKGK